VVGPDWEADEVPVTLTAQVTQAADGNLGPIDQATVEFTDDSTGETLCTATVTTSGTGPGTAGCTVQADLSELDQVGYSVVATAGGWYGGQSTPVVVTVSLAEEPEPLPPETTITSGPSGWLTSTSATFVLASSAPDSEFICRLDGGRVDCDDGRVTLTGLSARTHRLSVVAEDEDGERDETPAVRDFAVPLDDAGLGVVGKWKRKHSGAAYLGTFSQTRRKGAALTWKVSDVRELALLVRTGKRYGKVSVYLDDALLGTVKTAGKTGSKLFRVGHFSGPRSGTVRLVSTSARTVRIDGLGVSTAPF